MSGLKIIELDNNNIESTSKNAPKEEIPCVDIDEKWQKLVLYYLARLKGLCDWRNNSCSKIKPNAKIQHTKRCSSQELETRIIDNVMQKPITRKQNFLDANDIGCYIIAGYEEGKQQAVKIISRSLKYGVMTGILLKRGNCYQVAPEYLYASDSAVPVAKKKKNVAHNKKDCEKCLTRHKFSVKSVKTNVRKKDNKKKNIQKRASKYKVVESVTVPGKKRKCAINNCYVKKKKLDLGTSLSDKKGTKRNYDEISDENPPNYKKNKRSSDININLNESSNSNTTFQTLSRSLTPIDDRNKKRDVKAKRPRPKIQKPINYVPPLKKPRTKSQSKSPSHHTDDDEVNEIEKKVSNTIINKFRMPQPRRYSEIMSSVSSTTLSSSCTRSDEEKNQVCKRTRRK